MAGLYSSDPVSCLAPVSVFWWCPDSSVSGSAAGLAKHHESCTEHAGSGDAERRGDGEARTCFVLRTRQRSCGAMASGMPGRGCSEMRVAKLDGQAIAACVEVMRWARHRRLQAPAESTTHERFPQTPQKIRLPRPS